MIFLSKTEIEEFLEPLDIIREFEDTLQSEDHISAAEAPNYSFQVPNHTGALNLRAGLAQGLSILTAKINTSYPNNPQLRNLPAIHSIIIHYDLETGEILGFFEGGYLTAIRTAACAALATQYLSREDSKTVGLIGCGYQARFQIEAVCKVRQIDKIKVFDVNSERLNKFAKNLKTYFNGEIVAAKRADNAVTKSDICITVTTSSDPVVSCDWISPGTHINAIGAYMPDKREIDSATMVNAKVVVDSFEQCTQQAGDIRIPVSEGNYKTKNIHADLAQVVSGKKCARETPSEITLYKSVGNGLQDAIIAAYTYRIAKERKLGKHLSIL
jgi:ornithine cyclodeaminase/alanine dehydrogenase-like protein (mu-crystallin family)